MLPAKKIEKYRKALLEMRAKVLNRAKVNQAENFSLNPDDLMDESDHAAAVIQQSLQLNAQERDRFLLREIDHALSKMEDGSYGLCEDSEEPIDEGRLDAQPWTRYSVEAAEVREKRAKRFASNSAE
jgi:DnaK suppressor protein